MEGISLNTLISQILVRHVEWDRFAEDVGFASVTKPFLRAILEQVDDKTLTTIAVSACRGAMKDAMIYMTGKLNFEGFVHTIDRWLQAAHVPYRHIQKNGDHSYIIQHGLSFKWSVYFATVVNSVLNEIGYKTTEQRLDENSMSFGIEPIH